MSISINHDTCVRCGHCTETCPDTFFLDGQEGTIKIKSTDNLECAKKASDECPTGAIMIEE